MRRMVDPEFDYGDEEEDEEEESESEEDEQEEPSPNNNGNNNAAQAINEASNVSTLLPHYLSRSTSLLRE